MVVVVVIEWMVIVVGGLGMGKMYIVVRVFVLFFRLNGDGLCVAFVVFMGKVVVMFIEVVGCIVTGKQIGRAHV